jgi:DNA-binding NarL/FixJ family response regulator
VTGTEEGVAAGATAEAEEPAGRTIRVLLVDDEPLLRLAFTMVLDAQSDMAAVGEAGDGAEAVRKTRALRPDVVLMDVRMPGTDGIEATARIIESCPESRVLILTTFDLDEYAFAGLRAGASGFLLKNALPEELLGAIRSVAAGDAVVAPRITRRLLEHFADRAGTRGPGGGRPRTVQHRDRRAPAPGGGDGEDPPQPDPGEAGAARPGAGRGLRLRDPAGPPGLTRLTGKRARGQVCAVRSGGWPRRRGRGTA